LSAGLLYNVDKASLLQTLSLHNATYKASLITWNAGKNAYNLLIRCI